MLLWSPCKILKPLEKRNPIRDRERKGEKKNEREKNVYSGDYVGPSGVGALPLGVRRQNVVAILNSVF